MLNAVLSAAYVPFSLALALLFGLLGIEIAASLLGGSLLGADGAEADLSPDVAELQASFDLAPDAEPDVAHLLEASAALQAVPSVEAPAAGVLGLGAVPFGIWLAMLLLGFGLTGTAVQLAATAVLGAPLPVWLAAGIAAVAGLTATRLFGRAFAALLPRTETTATGPQFLGGLRGQVTQGIARPGVPAEVRVRDRHGNLHFLRCEPFAGIEAVPEGTEVLLLRERLSGGRWGLRILPVS